MKGRVMKRNYFKKALSKALSVLLSAGLLLSLGACVNQHQGGSSDGAVTASAGGTRIIATSHATMMICDRLGLDLIAIPTTSGEIPERYEGLPEIGTAMAPDAEAIALLEPDDVIGPDTLAETI